MDFSETARERLKQQEELFFRILQVRESDRMSALEAATFGDGAMREDILAMLQSEQVIEERISSSCTVSQPAGQMRRKAFPEVDAADWIGREIGPFRIEAFLGRGGMGVVFRARRAGGHLQQTVALKLLAESIHAPETVRQFESERDVLARMSHRNVARLIDAGVVAQGTPYIAMEFVEGTSLDVVLSDLTVPDAVKLSYFLQLCDAIEYVHDRLILHRDLKPNNVLVTQSGDVKLLDFGIAKLMAADAEDSPLTRAGLRPLAMRFASPERIAGGTLSTASDMYSLGAILGGYLQDMPPVGPRAGQPPVSPPRNTNACKPGLPPAMLRELNAIVRKAMQPAPQDRYSNARAFASDLRAAMESRTTKARRYGARDRAQFFLRRNKVRLSATALLLLLVLAGTAAIAHQSRLDRR